MEDHIAVDIGASSGRLVWGRVIDGELSLQEIHRFANGFTERGGHCYWNIDYLFGQVLIGLQKAKQKGITACTLGIDTWAVDYVLLDREGNRLEEVYAYRDERTGDAVERVTSQLSARVIYEKTGIQFQKFNTLFQLAVHDPAQLQQADKILLVPDYLYYLLTGRHINEVTNASTTQLLNLHTQDFDEDLLRLLSLTRNQFAELVQPGTVLGPIRQTWREKYDLPDCEVIAVATHDTASAVLGVPAAEEESFAYLSSGTWSLIGVETIRANVDEQAQTSNFTNEWGAFHTYRFLKNIMGLWLIQEVHRSYDEQYSFASFVEMATPLEAFRYYVDFTDDRFLHPFDMVAEIQSYCKETGQEIPGTPGEIARCIFDNLAILYALAVKEMEAITQAPIGVIHIVGGGANNELLCQWTANVSGKKVVAGPTESTAMGNLLVQMIASQKVKDVQEGRRLIRDSFVGKTYLPQDPGDQRVWFESFTQITKRGAGGSRGHAGKSDCELSDGEGTVRESRH
ncbi:rhamnulokinase [Brevibacillus invocatus]|uniref:rhamnulokinase n=1 Tax=Brevibacillus invocatus TaxID=173959 RepID=UPI00203B2955|nr:rhamnulokinase [Brevibacillus invocatus]MCM3429121.1 rhamnulokinase [Brevibacillus invocatus]